MSDFNDQTKLAMWDDLLDQNSELRAEYGKQCEIIGEMSKAIWQAKQALDAASAALLIWIDKPDEEIEPKKSRKIKPNLAQIDGADAEIAMLREELKRVQELSLRECGVGFVDIRILRPNAAVEPTAHGLGTKQR